MSTYPITSHSSRSSHSCRSGLVGLLSIFVALAATGIPGGPAIALTQDATAQVPLIDGLFDDWQTADVALEDPVGDATGGFDLVRAAAKVVGTQVFINFDINRELNLASGTAEDGTLKLELSLPGDRQLIVDLRGRRASLTAPGQEPVAVPWRDLDFVCLPTSASREFELRLDLGKYGLEPDQQIQFNFSGSDSLDAPLTLRTDGRQPTYHDLPATERSPGSLRIASMNTLRSGLADPDRQAGFKELVRFAAADVYCFNEEWDEPKFRAGVGGVLPWREMNTVWAEGGCAIASVHPLERLDAGLERAVAVVARAPGHSPIVLIAVHFKCCGFAGSSEDLTRIEEAEAVAAAVQKIRGGAFGAEIADAGIVVLGDYNLVGSTKPLDLIKAAGVQDVLLRSPIDGTAATWQGVSPTESFWPGRLDYVTYTPDRLTVSSGFLLTNRELAMLEGAAELPELVSDHAMMVIDVTGAVPEGR